MHCAMEVIILLQICQLFDALLCDVEKFFEFLNFVTEGY